MNMVGIIIIVVALIGGVVGGSYMHSQKAAEEEIERSDDFTKKEFFYTKLEKSLIVPIFEGGKSSAMLVAEVWLELREMDNGDVSRKKPRLRDEFLQVFAYYSSEGKLGENVLTPRIQAEIRRDLTRVGKNLIGDNLHAVLINDMQRQDL